MYESELFCQPLGERDSLPVCARTRSYSYAFPYCGSVSHSYLPSAHRGQRRYHVKISNSWCAVQTHHFFYIHSHPVTHFFQKLEIFRIYGKMNNCIIYLRTEKYHHITTTQPKFHLTPPKKKYSV
jgi:hypothetical protein